MAHHDAKHGDATDGQRQDLYFPAGKLFANLHGLGVETRKHPVETLFFPFRAAAAQIVAAKTCASR